jgi:hypothetical protein
VKKKPLLRKEDPYLKAIQIPETRYWRETGGSATAVN